MKKQSCIAPCYDNFNNLNSVIMEENTKYGLHIKTEPLNVIRDSCSYYGKTYEGRKHEARSIIGNKHALPICLNDQTSLCFVATGKHGFDFTYWISHQHVESWRGVAPRRTAIKFKDGQELEVPTSKWSLEQKIFRGAQIRTVFLKGTFKQYS